MLFVDYRKMVNQFFTLSFTPSVVWLFMFFSPFISIVYLVLLLKNNYAFDQFVIFFIVLGNSFLFVVQCS